MGAAAFGRRRDNRLVGLHVRYPGREIDIARSADLCGQLVTAGGSGVARQQDRIAVLQAFGRNDQKVLRRIRHIIG